MEVIRKNLISDNERQNFLPCFTGKKFLAYEYSIYEKLREATKGDYDGGYWDYYTLSNGGFYMGLSTNEEFIMECIGNYYKGIMGADAASIAVNLCIQNAFAWQVDAKKYSEHYHQLRNYALQHEEAAKIMAFID